MKHIINSYFLYNAAIFLLLSASDASASGKGAPIKRTQQKAQPQVTAGLQPHPAELKVDFSRPYPPEWNKLSVKQFFSTLQDKERPTSQFVVDWCNGMVSVFEEQSCEEEINEITLARLITLLGQKAKQNKEIKVILQKYFSEKPALMKYWREATTQSLKEMQFNEQALSNIFYGHAQLGLKLEGELYEAWKKAALDCLKSTNPNKQFNQQELSNIFYAHALLGLKPNEPLYEAWKNAALSCLKSTNQNKQFSQKELHSIYLTLKRFSLENFLKNDFLQLKVLKAKAPKGSKLQDDVYRSLQEYLKTIHVSDMPQEEYWVEEIASRVDIYLASKKLVIEVDGPSHFFPETKEYKPKNRLKEEILNQTHKFTQLVRIPYYEWNELTTAESKNKYFGGKLSLSVGQNVQTGTPKKEQEAKQVKHPSKTSTLGTAAPSFVPQAKRLPPKKKVPLSSPSKWKENEQVLRKS